MVIIYFYFVKTSGKKKDLLIADPFQLNDIPIKHFFQLSQVMEIVTGESMTNQSQVRLKVHNSDVTPSPNFLRLCRYMYILTIEIPQLLKGR